MGEKEGLAARLHVGLYRSSTSSLPHRWTVASAGGGWPADSRVPGGGDEVEAGVDACVVGADQLPLDLQLLLEVGLELAVDVVHDRPAAVRE